MLLHSMDKAYIVTLVVLLAASVYGSDTTLTPAKVIVNVGDNATFECAPSNIQSLPIVSTIDPMTNQSEGLVIANGRFVYEHVAGDSPFRRFTWLNASRQDHGRIFFCTFANVVSDNSTLYIAADLEIQLEEVGPFTVMRGDPLVVSITIEGFPPPNVIWSRDGVTISNNTMRTVGSTGISLSRVTPDDAGTYLVTAENGFSSDTETFEIIVIFAPIFIMGDRLSVREGESATINCSADAFPAVISYTLTNNGATLPLATDNSHTIDSTRMQDAGIYTCTATNDVNTSVLNINLEVGSTPGQVSNIMVDDKEDDITISWDAALENGVAILHYIIVLKYEEIEKELNTTGEATSITLTNEELHKLFSKGGEIMLTITITALNGIGKGDPFSVQETIKVEFVPGQVSNIKVTPEGDDSIISWDPAEDYGDKIIRYNIVIRYNGLEKKLSTDGPTTNITVTNEDLREFFSKDGELMVTITITAENGIGEGEPFEEPGTLQLSQNSGARSKLPHLLLSTLLVIFAYLIVF